MHNLDFTLTDSMILHVELKCLDEWIMKTTLRVSVLIDDKSLQRNLVECRTTDRRISDLLVIITQPLFFIEAIFTSTESLIQCM